MAQGVLLEPYMSQGDQGVELILFVYCQYPRYYCNCCSFMYCHINKLKKWLFYIYLLTNITWKTYLCSKSSFCFLSGCAPSMRINKNETALKLLKIYYD